MLEIGSKLDQNVLKQCGFKILQYFHISECPKEIRKSICSRCPNNTTEKLTVYTDLEAGSSSQGHVIFQSQNPPFPRQNFSISPRRNVNTLLQILFQYRSGTNPQLQFPSSSILTASSFEALVYPKSQSIILFELHQTALIIWQSVQVKCKCSLFN